MLKYTKLRILEKSVETIENTKKIEVILIYAKKNKSPHGVPRQDLPGMIKSLISSHKPRF